MRERWEVKKFPKKPTGKEGDTQARPCHEESKSCSSFEDSASSSMDPQGTGEGRQGTLNTLVSINNSEHFINLVVKI